MARGKNAAGQPKQVEALKHEQAKRKNIPTAELQSAAQRAEELKPFEPVVYQRRYPLAEGDTRPRDEDLDPQLVWKGTRINLTEDQIKDAAAEGYIDISEAQLVWRGKDQQDWSDLVVQAPPLYIQEKVHPKAIIDDLTRRTKAKRDSEADTADLFHDFNGIDPEAKTEFYQHDQNWTNRFILGDSLQVMASLAEREALRGQVQCIYFDPPYGIKFRSNWQTSTRSRQMSEQDKLQELTRDPELVQAFRDTWKDGTNSYLTYLRDRLTAMRDLLTESGSIFFQIGDENVHVVRSLLDEVFGPENFIANIAFKKKKMPLGEKYIFTMCDYIIWYGKDAKQTKFRKLFIEREFDRDSDFNIVDPDHNGPISLKKLKEDDLGPFFKHAFQSMDLRSSGRTENCVFDVDYEGKSFSPSGGKSWKTNVEGIQRLKRAHRLYYTGDTLRYRYYIRDYPVSELSHMWMDTQGATDMTYVVQTSTKPIERCLLMATDPGDLVLDPTCGSGTTAAVSEQLGRRWITIDTSRVALALARARIMGAKYPYYLLADSNDGRLKESKLTGKLREEGPTHDDIRQGFVYERVPHVTIKSIATNSEIDVIWEEYQEKLVPLLHELNAALGRKWKEWEIPREPDPSWSDNAQGIHHAWWELRLERQKKIDDSIARRADFEMLYDRPYEDKSRVRVAGPFTVESLLPHRVVPSDEAELAAGDQDGGKSRRLKGATDLYDFTDMILEHLKSSGVQQAKKANRISFESIDGWPGDWIAADGRFMEGEAEKRAAIFIGPEFGTVSRADLTAAAREALDARFDVLIACGFAFEAHTSELNKLGPLPIVKAKMNPDLHMSDELKNTGAGNLFVVFGEPDIKWDFDEEGEVVVEVLGVDVFDPKTGEVRASGKDDIAAWFIDTDYNEESFFVRHAYFMGANDPYKSLKTSLKAEIDQEAWETLYRDRSRPFQRPDTGRFAVKVINHFGDEVMKVFAV